MPRFFISYSLTSDSRISFWNTWMPILNRKIWVREIICPRFPMEKKIKSKVRVSRKQLHWARLSEYTQSWKEKIETIKGKPRNPVAQFSVLFLTATGRADRCPHTYHHLCFFAWKNIPGGPGTLTQAVRNKYLQFAGISSSWALNSDGNPVLTRLREAVLELAVRPHLTPSNPWRSGFEGCFTWAGAAQEHYSSPPASRAWE